MPLDQADFDSLTELVYAPNRNEVACGDLLAKAGEFLVRGTAIDARAVREDQNFFGSTDIVVSASMRSDMNAVVRKAFIWEIKAPQCIIMERDDNGNRYRPTNDLIKAENQLIHYANQAQGDHEFRERFEIVDHRNILIGGIVIGRSDLITSVGASDGEKSRARRSLDVRSNYLYASHQIQVMTWDRVLEGLRPL